MQMLGIVLDAAALASVKCATDSIYSDFLAADSQNRSQTGSYSALVEFHPEGNLC